jgi:CAAX protease family protein
MPGDPVCLGPERWRLAGALSFAPTRRFEPPGANAMTHDPEHTARTVSERTLPPAAWRWVELFVLFAGVPLLFWWWRASPNAVVSILERVGLDDTRLANPGRFMIPMLGLFTVGCLAFLLMDPSFPKRRLWNLRAAKPALRGILVRFVVLAGLMTLFTWQLEPGSVMRGWVDANNLGGQWLGAGPELFSLPRINPRLWAIIMVFYPMVSVWPQELLYRAFFFHRYQRILARPLMRVLASAFAFGFMHIIFMNPIAPALCLLGGVLFAQTYQRTQSTFAASFEHALYGGWVFTVGLGSFFYGGTYGGTVG